LAISHFNGEFAFMIAQFRDLAWPLRAAAEDWSHNRSKAIAHHRMARPALPTGSCSLHDVRCLNGHLPLAMVQPRILRC
jgi:hypothetical protein